MGSFSIYQLKGGNETLDYRFEPLDSIHRNGLSVKPENYELVYEAPLTAKDDLESMIDGVINNGRRGEELEKAKEHAERTQPEKKPSIRERLAAAKQECAKQQPRPAPEKKPPELGEL